MTQEKINEQQNFSQKFRNLPILEQEKVANFFNLHNAATWVYLQMSKEAKDYCQEAINCSSIAMKDSIKEASEDMKREL